MQVLIANGFPNSILVNGQQDGPPRYFVSSAALLFLTNHTGDSAIINESANIKKSRNNNKTKYIQNRKSMEEVTVNKLRRSERVKENDREQQRQRQTRSHKRVEVAKRR
jgi:hypothetical protein